jgi:hypothetical protein
MKKYFLIIISFLIFSKSYSQDKFLEGLIQLQIDYNYEIINNGNKYEIKDSIDEWLNNSFNRCIQNDTLFVILKDIEFLKTVIVKSIKPIEENLYLQVGIQEWTFKNIESANLFMSYILRQNTLLIECINKGGIKWWQIDTKIYMLYSNAYRFSFEFEKIINSMNKKLK